MTETAQHQSHTISLRLSNKPGVLNRVVLVFSRRGWNIDSLSVSPGSDDKVSRCSIVATGDSNTLSKIVMQLNKLVDVINAHEYPMDSVVHSELALIKIKCASSNHPKIDEIVQPSVCNQIDHSASTLTLQIVGSRQDLDQTYSRLNEKFGVLEMVRTGTVLLTKGEATT